MMKSGLEKIFLKFLHAQAIFRLIDLLHKVEGSNSVIKMTWSAHAGIFKKKCDICTHGK